jgi:hypothetical protein
MPEIVEQIGSYAGFAAMVGLAVLSALYFSQARDVKRLREWAGRAPEREPAEKAAIQARAQASAQAAQQRLQSQPQSPVQPQQATQGGKPAPASAAATATSAPPAGAGAKPGAAKPAVGNGGPAGPGKAPPVGGTPRVPAAQQTAILPPSAKARPPWYRRIALPEPRYLALIVAGVLIVGGGAAFGLTQLGGDDAPSTPAADQPAGEGGGERQQSDAPPSPAEITVSVLNGTTVTGLASQFQDALAEAGYDVGNAANFSDQAKAESVVLYAEGARPAARVVANDLEISQIERVDPDSQTLGGNASVIVVLGADKTP